MTRSEFEAACVEQNRRADQRVERASDPQTREACDTIIMCSFGGETYCRAHRIMGACPFGMKAARS